MSASAVPSRLSEAGPSTTTPVKRPHFVDSPGRSRLSGASPAYSSRRHSLYGIEDRVVIDPGSRIWKVGFSGEHEPRAVFWAQDERDAQGTEIWDLDQERLRGVNGDRKEGAKLVGVRIVKKLRETFTKHLMADPKLRKVIIIENTYMPNLVKEYIARALFENLKIPSVSFAPSSVLSLAACGRITGLVVDCGWIETTITPVYYSRPLYHFSRSTPLAGRSLHRRMKALLHHYATFYPQPTSLSNLERIPSKPPISMLTDKLIERIITEASYVGSSIDDLPVMPEPGDRPSDPPDDEMDDVLLMDTLQRRYSSNSTAKDWQVPVLDRKGKMVGTLNVPGWTRQRAAEALFDDDEIGESDGLSRAILQCILKLPVDLRAEIISTILVVGGTASLPGFIPRLRVSLLRLLTPRSSQLSETSLAPIPSALQTSETKSAAVKEWRKRHTEEPYAALYGLSNKLAILNDPSPLEGEGSLKNAGVAPRWTPSLMSWVGGSLAGALKTSGNPMLLEDYDNLLSTSIHQGEAYKQEIEADEVELAALVGIDINELRPGQARSGGGAGSEALGRRRGWKDHVISDWTRQTAVA